MISATIPKSDPSDPTYSVRSRTLLCPGAKPHKTFNTTFEPSVRNIIVARASLRRVRQCIWRRESLTLPPVSRPFSLTGFAAAGNKHRRQSTDHFGSHVTMSSNRASALYTVPGHRLSSAMSVEAVGELVEARTGSRDAQPHRCAKLFLASARCMLMAMLQR